MKEQASVALRYLGSKHSERVDENGGTVVVEWQRFINKSSENFVTEFAAEIELLFVCHVSEEEAVDRLAFPEHKKMSPILLRFVCKTFLKLELT